MDILSSVLAVVLVLGGLIFFHELGHFILARILGIGVRTFSLGFGPKLITSRRGKTDYCLSLIPLGGYVALAGEEEEGEKEQEKAPVDPGEPVFSREEEFYARPAGHRLLVVLAGPLANFLLAVLIYWGIAWSQGQMYVLPIIGSVVADGPAAEAGLLAGDTVLAINGEEIREWRQISSRVGASDGQALDLLVVRDGVERRFTVTPRQGMVPTVFGEQRPAWLLGIKASDRTGVIPLGPIEALTTGLKRCWEMIALTCESLVKLVQRVVPLDDVGGPILIAQMIGQQTEQGLIPVLMLAALISINLGILNLLPIPVLDGGHIAFFLMEMLRGKPLSATVQAVSAKVGMALLLALMILATWNDLVRLFS